MDVIVRLLACTGFDWDEGNLLKNWERHGVTAAESEQVFFNRPLLALSDEHHSAGEDRFFLLGRTDSDRHLFLVFTIREDLIRVISARDMSRKERRSYEGYGKKI
ncbi:MAG: BrnT family toxin [Candidatus Krumholzibacteria bacterium]|nr:BrnT family toxin [Candidatus Krumholzibacteria bacterium]